MTRLAKPKTHIFITLHYRLLLIYQPEPVIIFNGDLLLLFIIGALKHISYEELRKCILRCDTSVLTENLLQALIHYIPAPDQLNRLKDFESEYDNLAEAEQFAISISGIKRLVPRLKSLKFQQTYPELVQECKPHIVSATAACEEVKKSKKFARILELILLFGKFEESFYSLTYNFATALTWLHISSDI